MGLCGILLGDTVGLDNSSFISEFWRLVMLSLRSLRGAPSFSDPWSSFSGCGLSGCSFSLEISPKPSSRLSTSSLSLSSSSSLSLSFSWRLLSVSEPCSPGRLVASPSELGEKSLVAAFSSYNTIQGKYSHPTIIQGKYSHPTTIQGKYSHPTIILVYQHNTG